MLLLKGLICGAVAACSIGAVTAAPGIDFTVPEPQQPACVLRVTLQPEPGAALSPQREQAVLRSVAERVRLLVPGAAVPRLVRRNGEVLLHLFGDIPNELLPEVAKRLQCALNRRVQTYFAAVHPRQEALMQRAEVVSLINRYELDVMVWPESDRRQPPPRLPYLPDEGDTAGYILAEQVGMDDRGMPAYGYLIVRAPEVARSEGLLVSNEDVEKVAQEPRGTAVNPEIAPQDSVSIRLSPEASARLHRLTLPLARSGGQIALVSDGTVLAVATVPAPLSREFILTSTNGRDMVFALLPPLPCKVKTELVQGSM